MPVMTPEIKSFTGLYKQANSFALPDGALEEATNFVLTRDGILSKRRGFYDFYTPSGQTLNNLHVYQSKIIGVFNNELAYFTETGTAPSKTGVKNALTGATVAVTDDRVSRVAESNNNLYLTSDNGVLKLEAYDGTVYSAGVPPAIDLRAKFTAANGPIAADTQVAWRVAFGRRDSNQNLLIGAPSDIIVLTNSAVVGAAWVCATNVITVTTTVAHNLAAGMQITVSNSTSDTSEVTAGTYTIASVPSATTFTFAFTVGDDASGNTLDYTATRVTLLEIGIPSEIDTLADGYFVQITRSTQTGDADVSPRANFKLIEERRLTAAELAAGVVFYEDDTDDILLGAELYTNPNSREGEAQANDRPPLCEDITLFKGHMVYAACTARHLMSLDMIDPASLATGNYVEVKVGTTVRRYVARTGVANETVRADSVADNGAGGFEINYVAHGLADGDRVYISNVVAGSLATGFYYVINRTADDFDISATPGGAAVAFAAETSVDFQGDFTRETAVTTVAWVRASNVVTVTSAAHGLAVGMTVYASNSSGGVPEVAAGLYTITAATTDTFSFAETATDDASGNTLDFAAFHAMFKIDTTSSSAAVKLRNTAQGFTKAVNRDADSLVYARYVSTITGTGADSVPGRMRLQAKGFTDAIYLRASTQTAGEAFFPVLPASFAAGDQVYSQNDDLPSTWFVSKSGEPEAVPLLNKFPTGARNQRLLRVVALRDVMLVIKADGVYRVTGDSVASFSVTPLDTTIACISASSVKKINDEVIFLSNQGWVRCTDSSVQIISRNIEDPVNAIVGDADIETLTGAVAYESEHLYLVSTREPDTDEASITYVYNVFTGTWTDSDVLLKQGIVGPSDTLYLIDTDGTVVRERKNQTKIDYCGQNYGVTVTAVAADELSATITSLDATPKAGWVIVKSDFFSRITGVTPLGSQSFTVTFAAETNLEASDTLQLYASYKSTAKLAPFHAGMVGRMKQYSQIMVHLRQSSVSELLFYFTNTYFDTSDYTTWTARESARQGWGQGPWGAFPWGDTDSINLSFGTTPMPPARVFVPAIAQRATFIQPVIEHDQAGEPIAIQAITFVVRPYGERVSA